jgi:hypothetical protein
LRTIIERIADEDRFDCVFTNRLPTKMAAREIKFTINKSTRKRINSDVRTSCSTANVEVSSIKTSNQEVVESSAVEGDEDKQAINYCKIYSNEQTSFMHCSSSSLHHNQCLLYWQENLSIPKKIFKS